MAQKKANEVESWLQRPAGAFSLVLFYGPDRGLVTERAAGFVAGRKLPVDDPFCVTRIDAGELDAAPGRLIEEAHTVPMFSDKRLIWVRNAGAHAQLAEQVKHLLSGDMPEGTTIVIEAGELRKGAPLRSTVEGASNAMALPCYPDEDRAIDRLIDEELARTGLAIAPDARALLRANLGGDRLASRGEIEKLALYCRERSRIEPQDVALLTGDVSARGADDVVDAVLTGGMDAFDRTLTRLITGGAPSFLVLSATMRQFLQLQLMRHAMDSGGGSAGAIVAAARPPVFFARRRIVERALHLWEPAAIARALDRLQAAILATRKRPELASQTTRQALLALVVEAGRARA